MGAGIIQFIEGTGGAKPHQLTALYGHVQQPPLCGLDNALSIGVLQPDEAQMPGLHLRFLRHGLKHGFRFCGFQGAAPHFLPGSVVGHGLQRSVFIGHMEGKQAVILHGLLSHGLAVQQQLHLCRPGVYLYMSLLSLAALPGPAGHGIGHLPGRGGMALAVMAQGAHRKERSLRLLKGNTGVQRLTQRLARQVNAPAAGTHPAQPGLEVLGILRKLPAAHHDFAQIVKARPHKVTDEPGIVLCQLPEFIGIGAEGFAAQNQPVGIFFQILFVAFFAVVIPGNVHVGKSLTGGDIAAVEGGTQLHEISAHNARHVIEEFGTGGCFLCFFARRLGLGSLGSFLFCLFVGILPEADGVEEIEENIDAAGHRAGAVQTVKQLGHFLCQRNAPGLGGFRHLVAGGVENHTGVIVVLVHHVGHVLLPEPVKEFHIVILGLVDIPVVDVLIHHQHSHAVAYFQGGLGAGIVGGADGIVAVFLENPQPPFQGIGMAGST